MKITQDAPPLLCGDQAVRRAFPQRSLHETVRRTLGTQVDSCPTPPLLGAPLDPHAAVLVCPQAPEAAANRALAALRGESANEAHRVRVEHMRFSTGDPFTIVYGDVRHRPVVVAQDLAPSRTESLGERLVVALQSLCAAQSAGAAEHAVLALPAWADPQRHGTPLNRLIARLAKVSGAREIHYRSELGALPENPVDGKALAQATAAQLTPGTAPDRTAALLRLARSQGRQAGRRGMDDLEQAWQEVELRAAQLCAAGDTASTSPPRPPLIVAVQSCGELGKKLAATMKGEVATCTFDPATGAFAVQPELTGRDVIVVHNTRGMPGAQPSAQAVDCTLEALLAMQLARETGAKTLSVVQAYQMNSRSDRAEQQRATDAHIGAYGPLVAEWFKGFKPDRTVLIECHDVHTPTAWRRPTAGRVDAIGGMELMLQHTMHSLSAEQREAAVLALPDEGAKKRAADIMRSFKQVLVCDKSRSGHDTGATVRLTRGSIDPAAHVYLPDDEVGTGGTLAQSLKLLHERGARRVHALICHNNLPMDPVRRNWVLALLRASGAESLHFLDTQPLGPVVSSYEELQRLPGSTLTEGDLRAFLAVHRIEAEPEELFANLNAFVGVISAAPAIADALVGGLHH